MRRPKPAVLLSSDDDVEKTPSKKACKGEPSSSAKVTGRGKVQLIFVKITESTGNLVANCTSAHMIPFVIR